MKDDCPSDSELADLLTESLHDFIRSALEEHVGECAHCQDRLERLVAESTEWHVWERCLNTQHLSWPSTHPAGNEVDPNNWPVVPGYEIVGILGRGGMGIVYRARQLALNRWVALKKLHANNDEDRAMQRRLRREAESLASLQHPNVIQIYEILEQNETTILSLELVEGGTLAQRLRFGILSPGEAATMVEILARAVQVAHNAGVLHRDLKPANVLMTIDGAPKITDFGLARRLETSGDTKTGHLMGTPSYVAPEQARALPGWSTIFVDTYALGAILYETLTGKPPFRAGSSMETLLQVVQEKPVPPSRLQKNVPRDLETICLKCLEKEPHRRYESARDLAEDLRRFQEGEPISARRISWWAHLGRWTRRRPAPAALAGGLCLSVLLLLGLWGKHTRDLAVLNRDLQQQTKRAEDNQARAELEQRQTMVMTSQIIANLRRHSEAFVTGLTAKGEPLNPTEQQALTQTLTAYAQALGRVNQADLREEQARNYHWLGHLALRHDSLGRAEHYFQRAVSIREGHERQQGRDPNDSLELAIGLLDRGHVLVLQGRLVRAEQALRRALLIIERQPVTDQNKSHVLLWHTRAHYELGHVLSFQNKEQEAERHFRAAKQAIEQVRIQGREQAIARLTHSIEGHLQRPSR